MFFQTPGPLLNIDEGGGIRGGSGGGTGDSGGSGGSYVFVSDKLAEEITRGGSGGSGDSGGSGGGISGGSGFVVAGADDDDSVSIGIVIGFGVVGIECVGDRAGDAYGATLLFLEELVLLGCVGGFIRLIGLAGSLV